MKVDVLGTRYDVIFDVEIDTDEALSDGNIDGYCNCQEKVIKIAKFEDDDTEMVKLYRLKVLRHELIHAFFYESGMSDWCDDETLVDYLAIQMPKISKVFQDLNVMERWW